MASQDRGNFDRIRASPTNQKGGQAQKGSQASQSQPGGKSDRQMGDQNSGRNLNKDPLETAGAGRRGGEHSGEGKR